VCRVIKGYEYQGTRKDELLREKITWSNFSRDNAHKKLLDQVQSLENLESDRFDAIKKTIKDGELIVTGEKKITEQVEKSTIYSTNLRSHTHRFYNYFVRLVMQHDNETLKNACIKIDGSGRRVFRREMEHYLRR